MLKPIFVVIQQVTYVHITRDKLLRVKKEHLDKSEMLYEKSSNKFDTTKKIKVDIKITQILILKRS